VNNIFYDLSNANFTIIGAVPCTATVPTGLNASNVGSNTVNLSWNAVAGASSYTVRYRPTGTSTWTTTTVVGSNSTTLTSLTANTQYEVQVRSVCPDSSTSAYSTSVVFTTTVQQLSYCASNGNNTSDEYIGNVTLGSINNTTGAAAGGYADFTALSTNLTKGVSNTISISPVWTGTTYAEGYSVWIDYNQDGDFADAGEQVFSQAATTSTSVSGSFTVGAAATNGATRMRVSMKYNAIPTACESFTYGEVEDYTVNILDGVICNAPTGLSIGSITSNSATASWNVASNSVNYTVRFRQTGTSAWTSGAISGTSANLTGLGASTTYEVQVRNNCSGSSSAYTASVNFTTSAPPVNSCTGGITAFPYSEGFESGFGGWTQASGDDFDWSRRSGSTPSNNTGPSSAAEGTFYMYTESSTPNYSNKVAIFNSPCFDLSGESSAVFDFQYHMYGASNMGNLVLEVSDDNGTSWTSVWSASGNQGNAWLSASVDLGAYVGSAIELRYVGTTGTTWRGDMAIDDLSLSDGAGPSCVDLTLTL
ncbi:MAG: GEVED domain-containing protein, partial [Bacteroidota bacterium]